MNNIIKAARSLGIEDNLILRVIDIETGKIVQQHVAHNTATNSLLLGIGHYLIGDGILNQGYDMLRYFIPRYISLGTMGLITQDEDTKGLPAGIGVEFPSGPEYDELVARKDAAEAALDAAKQALAGECPYYIELGTCYTGEVCDHCDFRIASKRQALIDAQNAYDNALNELLRASEIKRLTDYIRTQPGYGADGYDGNQNNNRKYFGLGPMFADREDQTRTVNCELISDSFPRTKISFRDVVPEIEAELPKTVDVVFSTMISTGALRQFREPGRDYIFITEAGLWSIPEWNDSGENGLLAGYRLLPSDRERLDMDVEANRELLKRTILKVRVNQVVQVIWKIQLGSLDQFPSEKLYREMKYNFDYPDSETDPAITTGDLEFELYDELDDPTKIGTYKFRRTPVIFNIENNSLDIAGVIKGTYKEENSDG